MYIKDKHFTIICYIYLQTNVDGRRISASVSESRMGTVQLGVGTLLAWYRVRFPTPAMATSGSKVKMYLYNSFIHEIIDLMRLWEELKIEN